MENRNTKVRRMNGKTKCGIYTQWDIIQPLKKRNSDMPLTWINLEDIMLNEISQSQKNKYCMIPLTLGT